MNVTLANSYTELLQLLEDDIIDVAVLPRLNGVVTLKTMNNTTIREVPGTLEIFFLYHYVHKKNEHIVPELQKALKKMLLEGTTRKLRDKAHERLQKGEI